MGEFGLLSFFSAGQVMPDGSWLHRLDPRTRLLGMCGLMLALIFARRVEIGLLGLAAVLALTLAAHVPLRFAFRGLLLLLPWILVLVGIQVLFRLGNSPGCRPLLTWGILVVTDCTVNHALLMLTRFAGMVMLVGLFTWTTPIPDFAHGLEALAGPLDKIGLPANELAMVGIIAIRFVPTFAMEMERLQKAQRARGADLDTGKANFFRRIRRTLPMIVPLFVLALRRAERLAEAMEARVYGGGRGRGRYARLRLLWVDWAALFVVALFDCLVLIVF